MSFSVCLVTFLQQNGLHEHLFRTVAQVSEAERFHGVISAVSSISQTSRPGNFLPELSLRILSAVASSCLKEDKIFYINM